MAGDGDDSASDSTDDGSDYYNGHDDTIENDAYADDDDASENDGGDSG